MHALYRFEVQGVILEPGMCSTTPIRIKRVLNPQKPSVRAKEHYWEGTSQKKNVLFISYTFSWLTPQQLAGSD